VSDAPSNPVFDAAMAYQKTAALVAAVKLDVFTAIGSDTLGPDELASRTGASSRGLRILCDFFSVMELLKKEGSKYSLMSNARILLDRSSPFAMGGIVDFVAAPEMVDLFLGDPASYVRRGGLDGASNVDPNNPIWVRYARAMVPFASATAKRVAAYVARLQCPPASVLDVAAGHGLYGIEVARALEDVMVTAVDWGNVLEVARIHAEEAGVGDRIRMLAGDALRLDWGRGFDLILLPNFLHHFDAETCTSLLRKVRGSLSRGGKAVAIDFVPNEDRVSPPVPAMFAFWMLATTPRGDAYTASEYDEMARMAGFHNATTTPLLPTPQSLIVFD
jgi:2-polyprenyl-3-methyl-5-hydroxy-6-metoxy-1,4-benzoquinol methylase